MGKSWRYNPDDDWGNRDYNKARKSQINKTKYRKQKEKDRDPEKINNPENENNRKKYESISFR